MFLEDATVGETFELGPEPVRESDMLEFARRYDPQPFHSDPVGAAASPMGGLIASGWHTCAVAMLLLCRAAPFGGAPILGSGVDKLRWPRPVRAGAVLSGTARVVAVRPSTSRPDRGSVTLEVELRDGEGRVVLSMLPTVVLPRRPIGKEWPPRA